MASNIRSISGSTVIDDNSIAGLYYCAGLKNTNSIYIAYDNSKVPVSFRCFFIIYRSYNSYYNWVHIRWMDVANHRTTGSYPVTLHIRDDKAWTNTSGSHPVKDLEMANEYTEDISCGMTYRTYDTYTSLSIGIGADYSESISNLNGFSIYAIPYYS